MMIYYFRNKTALAWFVLGIIFVAMPVGYVLEQRGIELNTYNIFLLGACGALLGVSIQYLIQKLVGWRKFLKLSKYWNGLEKELQVEASRKYPIKHLAKDAKESEEQFTKRIDYESVLREPFKRKVVEKFHLNEAEWKYFQGQLIMGFKRHDNMVRGKKY